ncbi:hypothetical protein [Falsirhodobacter algicola]|uniref:Uncharacterized protein n=1 Tax=Falsirhodobacter algicola TaxID=2692330 RepID=A0A8J8MSZ5_9RHOB|nr:hypothetical protein [Falsirhodobacter algicola]QUS35919.1 hypothetical protein GR316_06390 [Falsirhodobacter algicola]
MDVIADILLAAGALGAAIYCAVLSARLKRFASLDSGMGGAIAILSAQVEELSRALTTAQAVAGQQAAHVTEVSARAEAAAKRLELLVASLHDLEVTP